MADFKALNYTRILAVPAQAVDGGDYGGRTRHVYDEYVTTGAETTNDRIFVGTLDAGERVLDGWVLYGALGGSVTLKLGDAADDDRLLLATAASSAGVTRLTAATGLGYKPSGAARVPLFLTLGGGTAATGQAIRVHLAIGRD
jgi:hypothetical protein